MNDSSTSFFTRRALSLLFAIMLAFSASAFAGDVTGDEQITESTEYFFGIPHCWIENGEATRGEPIQVFVSSKVNTLATVEGLGLGYKISRTIPANKVIGIPIPEAFMNKTSEEIKQLGLHVTAPDPISVTVFLSYRWSGEAYRVIPVDWLGRKYYTLNLYQDKTDQMRPSQILICGVEDKTTVKFTPTAETEGGVRIGQSREITINKGETYLIRAAQREALTFVGGDLTGTLIESDKPVGVLAGHTKGAYPNYNATMLGRPANFMRNMYMEMMWPVELLGTEYISAPLKYLSRTKNVDPNDAGDLVRFVATQDNTQIYQMRQDGGGAKLICLRLDKGKYFDIPNQELPAHYRATKPVLVGHYGKAWRDHVVNGIDKGETPDNPSRNGMGMMLVLTPIDRWTKYAIFRSSEHTDNFVYITYYTEDEGGMKFDGKPFRTAFLGSIKPIAGTQYSYVAQQVSAGDHTIDGGRFAAYAYGNYDYTKDGYAYGYPTGINYATPCPDSLAIEDKIVCGNVDATAKALPNDAVCAGIFNVRMIDDLSDNYNFELSPKFVSGDKIATFKLTVIDKFKPAKAVVRVVSRSGKFLMREYTYEPEQITIAPTLYDFKTVGIGEKRTTTFTVTNSGKVPVTIQNLKLKYGEKEFTFNSVSLPMILQPGESRTIEVEGTGITAGRNTKDSIIAELTCFPKSLAEVRLNTALPKVYVDDAHFGQVPINQLRKKSVSIKNISEAKVTLTSMSWPDADKNHFPKVEDLTFPLELAPGQTSFFTTYYTPLTEIGVMHKTRALFVGNTDQVKLYSDWDGEGIEAGLYIEGFDWHERRVLDNFVDANTKANGYAAVINYGSTGNSQVQNVKLTVSGPDGAYFVVPVNDVAQTLNPKEAARNINVAFKPEWVIGTHNGERPYEVTLTLSGMDNGVEKTATSKLKGVGVQPHIDMLPKIDFGTILPGTTKSDNSWVKSVGTMALTLDNKITGLRIDGADKAYFAIDPSFSITYPNAVNIGGQIDVPIIFKPDQVRSYTAELIVESDAPETPKTILVGQAYQDKSPSVSTTDHNFGKHYIKVGPYPGTVSITNTGEIKGKVIRMEVVDNDRTFFNVKSPQPPFDLGIGQTVAVDADFSPVDVRVYNARVEYEVEWEGGSFPNSIVYSNLVGEGDAIVSLVKIRDDYKAKPGESVVIDFDLADANLNPANVDEFKAFVRYNPIVAEPVEGVQNIITSGTLTNGWKVLQAVKIPNTGEFMVDMIKNGGTDINGPGVLFRFTMKAYLSPEHQTALPCEMSVIGRPYVTVNNLPGLLKIEEVCADRIRAVTGSGIKYGLMATMPNPTNGETKVEYSIGIEAPTTLAVYNELGERVAVLVNQNQTPGAYEVTFDISKLGLPSGTYSYRLVSGPFSDVKTLIINR